MCHVLCSIRTALNLSDATGLSVPRCRQQIVQKLPVQHADVFGLCATLHYVRCQQFVVTAVIVIRTEAVSAVTVQRYCLGKTEIAGDKLLPLLVYPLKFAC